MKKLISTIALGTLLVAGFMFAQDNQPTNTADMEWEPSVFSVDPNAPGF
ncbi:MAG TPA: hypothetical protein VK142_05905 [Bacillota bacterium]|nr:hypothetical protein [Bacillota bacterium]